MYQNRFAGLNVRDMEKRVDGGTIRPSLEIPSRVRSEVYTPSNGKASDATVSDSKIQISKFV